MMHLHRWLLNINTEPAFYDIDIPDQIYHGTQKQNHLETILLYTLFQIRLIIKKQTQSGSVAFVASLKNEDYSYPEIYCMKTID